MKTFSSREEHRAFLASQSSPPRGFRLGATRFEFTPVEVTKPARMNVTLIALDRPTPDFAAMFTRNALCGAPVHVGRRRLAEPRLGAVVINNKISNVCAEGGVEAAERICGVVAKELSLLASEVIPSSTGVIGWQLPVDAICRSIPDGVRALDARSVLPAAEAIMTTDLYPKVRRVDVGGGSVVGIAKGAGMVEPQLATMLVYLMTDLAVPRERLRVLLPRAVNPTFNCISIDSDTSTSDTVMLLSSGLVPCTDEAAFARALETVCRQLADDIVRNGEGVHHVMRVVVTGCPEERLAREVGKAIVNSPLIKTAVCGNDPNVGRFVAAIGKHLGLHAPGLDTSRTRLTIGGHVILDRAIFRLDSRTEGALVSHFKDAELYASVTPGDGVYKPPVDFPPHDRCLEIEVDMGVGKASATVIGGDLTHEYISENADYRS